MPLKRQKKSERFQIPEARYGGRIVTKLINSVYYHLNHVLIICNSEEEYRLMVVHNGLKLMDKTYKGLKNARIAFEKTFKSKRFRLSSKTEWSELYEAEQAWVKEMEDTPYSGFSRLPETSTDSAGFQENRAVGKKRAPRRSGGQLVTAATI